MFARTDLWLENERGASRDFYQMATACDPSSTLWKRREPEETLDRTEPLWNFRCWPESAIGVLHHTSAFENRRIWRWNGCNGRKPVATPGRTQGLLDPPKRTKAEGTKRQIFIH